MKRRIPILAFALALAAIVAASLPSSASAQLPEEFTNLQVLPEDIATPELIGYMRGFAMGLGVRCTHCHVGEEGRPFSEFDFASDEKEPKRKARFMLEMTMALNSDVLPGISEVATRTDPAVRVQCVTCHRGVSLPRQINEVVAMAAADGGGDAAVAKYRELREVYYGSGSYDFGEQPLIEIASGLGRGDPDAALAIFDLALEYYPESVQALVGTAQVYMARDDKDAARAALLKAQELAPDQPQIQRMLQQLDGGLK
ncbi:MAG: c-type cytochrome [Gemmatimonadota bacterium]|nr:c-type cytochrome [Gemmatimonadota bacterium]